MVQAMAHEGLLPFKDVVADGLSGKSPAFLDAVDACVGVTTCVALPADTRCWLQAPRTAAQVYREKGEGRAKRVVVAPDTAPCPVAAFAARLPASRWYRRQVSEGTTGPIMDALARQRVTRCQDGLPERTVWLVITRSLGAEPPYASDISHAPVSTSLRPFVWFSGLRWAMEQCCEAGKTARGMAHYAVRKYPGWYHHRLTTIRAHCFWWHLKRHVGKKSSGPHRVTAADILGGRLPPTDVYD